MAWSMDQALRTITPLVPEVVPGEFGEDAVLTGAISIALSSAEDIVFGRRNECFERQHRGGQRSRISSPRPPVR